MRIYRNRFYILKEDGGISGFRKATEYRLVSGEIAKLNAWRVVGEWLPTDSDVWRIEDGRLPEFQPIKRNGQKLYDELKTGVKAVYAQTIPPQPYFKGGAK